MNQEFVPYKIALELKELGFNEPCLGFYDCERDFKIISNKTNFLSCEVAIPLYQQVFRFFREKYNLHAAIYPIKQHWECDVRHTNKDINSSMFTWDKKFTYEEAELACLVKLIEIVKTNKL